MNKGDAMKAKQFIELMFHGVALAGYYRSRSLTEIIFDVSTAPSLVELRMERPNVKKESCQSKQLSGPESA